MRNDAKVVHLNKAVPDQKPSPPAKRLPVALIRVRDKASLQLRQALQTLFDNADDSLFKIADRATSKAEQSRVFTAMRDLRMKRRSIERGFLQHVFNSFATLDQYETSPASQLNSTTFESLTLPHNDPQEESTAIDTMVGNAMNRAGLPLSHLSTRINMLVSKKLDENNNPLGPRALCHYFLEACRSLGVETRIKLIILTLFEKYVLAYLDQLYAESNQILVAAGVLPELRSTPPHQHSGPEAVVDRMAYRDQPNGNDDSGQAFAALQSLLGGLRVALPTHNVPDDALPLSSNELLRLLSHMQTLASHTTGESDPQQQLGECLHRASAKAGRPRIVGEIDADTISLVSMLFEAIGTDRTLPDSLKTLIARLQIPIVKAAVLDKTLFSRGSHPARRLLNEIACASMGWGDQDEAERDSLYHKTDQVVTRLLDDFIDDPAIFSELLADFLAFTSDERRRSELFEQRTRDAEQGRAKAEMARQEVECALNQRLFGRTLPEVVVRLLQEAWSKVLLLTCLKHGTQSRQWQSALATMDNLIWSVAPHPVSESRARLLDLVPGLLKALREGLASAAFDSFATGEFFTQLEALHIQAMQQTQPPAALVSMSSSRDSASTVVEWPPTHIERIGPQPPAMVKVTEEIVLLAPGESREQEREINLPPDNDTAFDQLDNLRVGRWVEFQEDEEHKLRGKLAAIIKPTGKHIFVNRNGMKVLEKTRMGLAAEFRRGAIRILDDAPLFDRALEAVIRKLRRLNTADEGE